MKFCKWTRSIKSKCIHITHTVKQLQHFFSLYCVLKYWKEFISEIGSEKMHCCRAKRVGLCMSAAAWDNWMNKYLIFKCNRKLFLLVYRQYTQYTKRQTFDELKIPQKPAMELQSSKSSFQINFYRVCVCSVCSLPIDL